MTDELPQDEGFPRDVVGDPPTWSEDAEEIAHALIAASAPARVKGVSDEELGRFAIGWITAEEEARILEALVSSPQARARLIAVDAEVGRAPSAGGFVADAIQTSLRVYTHLARFGTTQGLSQALERGSKEAVAALAAFRSVGEALLAAPSPRWSPGRSGVGTDYPDDEGGIVAPGSAAAETYLREPFGREIPLEVGEEGRIAGIGFALGLMDEPLPPGSVVSASAPPEARELRLRVLGDPSAWLPLAEPPEVRSGILAVSFPASPEVRAQFAGSRVGLAIRVGDRWLPLIAPQRLPSNGDRYLLTNRVEGVDDGIFTLLSVLQVIVEVSP